MIIDTGGTHDVTLIDFGFAEKKNDQGYAYSDKGTPLYTAPEVYEQMRNNIPLGMIVRNAASELYSTAKTVAGILGLYSYHNKRLAEDTITIDNQSGSVIGDINARQEIVSILQDANQPEAQRSTFKQVIAGFDRLLEGSFTDDVIHETMIVDISSKELTGDAIDNQCLIALIRIIFL